MKLTFARRLLSSIAVVAAATLTACASGPVVTDYSNEKPRLDMSQFFNGDLLAHGLYTDATGKVVRRFEGILKGSWNGDNGTLEENFTYSDGRTDQRIWHLVRMNDGRYVGTADDVLGPSTGLASGNALHRTYTMRLPVDGQLVEAQFDDWMYQINDRVVLNKATVSRYGVKMGEVMVSFQKK